MPGLIIAGTNSGCGKTTVSLGLMALLKRKGYVVAPFKVGPDYIDPGHHQRVCGRPGRNLDGWMLSREYNLDCFERGIQGCDVAVVEGVMGLYDGYDGKSENGSTAQMAKWLDLPLVLVVNARSMARSAAALVSGFERFDPDLRFAGVIFNNVGSPRHLTFLKEAMEGHVSMPCLGGIFRAEDMEIPERHLGLVTDDEQGLSEKRISRLADVLEQGIDLEMLLGAIKRDEKKTGTITPCPRESETTVRIGVARDKAFCFYYQDNLDILRANGAELVFFSPLCDGHLPENLDGLYLGGGYPELFAAELSANKMLRHEIKDRSDKGMPIYGECGGFMYLCQAIRDFSSSTFPMTGCFPYTAVMLDKLRSLGYREITLSENTVIGKKGDVARGHEFHYSKISENGTEETVYRVTARAGGQGMREGYAVKRTLGSYIHLHFGSRPETGRDFVSSCMDYKTKEGRV